MENTLEISPNFTVEDIHKIRERNYEVTKHMTTEANFPSNIPGGGRTYRPNL